MKTNKTIREWLEELPEPYRTQALANAQREDLRDKTTILDSLNETSLTMALSCSFIWEDTPQGHKYWSSLAEQYEQNS